MQTARFLAAALTLTLGLAPTTAEAKPTKEQLQRAFELLDKGTRAGDFDVRATAVRGLGGVPKKDALPLILDALKDPQWKVRRSAIEALRDHKDRRWEAETAVSICNPAVEEAELRELLSALRTDAAIKLLFEALSKKECVKPERWVRHLQAAPEEWMTTAFKTALTYRFAQVKVLFTAALPDLPLPAALPVYKAAFAKLDPDIQKRIIERLRTASPEHDLSFVSAALKSKDTSLHFPAAELLGLRGKGDGRSHLVAALDSQDAQLRLRALRAIEPIAGKAEFERMKPIIKERETPYQELILAYSVYVKSDSNKLVTYLEGELESTDVPQRAAAVHFLGHVKGNAALPTLHGLINASAPQIRTAAIDAIGRLGHRDSIPVLRDALAREGDRTFQVAMLDALAAIRDAEIIPVVRFYINDTDARVKLAAVRALAAVPDPSALPDLEIAARDRLKDVRELALMAMLDQDPEGRFTQYRNALEWIDIKLFKDFVARHGDRVKRHLEEALRHQRADLRAAAFTALDGLTRGARQEVLAELVARSQRPEQRLRALDVLAQEQGAAAKELLVSLSSGGDEMMRLRAIAHLGRLGHKGAAAELLGWLDDPSEKIRIAAASAFVRL